MQNEAEDSYFINQKFLLPSLVFYPTFLTMSIIQTFEILIFTVFQDFSYQKSWGKKLLILKIWIFSFLLHKKSLKNIQNLLQWLRMKFGYVSRKISKNQDFWKIEFQPNFYCQHEQISCWTKDASCKDFYSSFNHNEVEALHAEN